MLSRHVRPHPTIWLAPYSQTPVLHVGLHPARLGLFLAHGAGTGFSLEGLHDLHFAVCTPPAAVEPRERARVIV